MTPTKDQKIIILTFRITVFKLIPESLTFASRFYHPRHQFHDFSEKLSFLDDQDAAERGLLCVSRACGGAEKRLQAHVELRGLVDGSLVSAAGPERGRVREHALVANCMCRRC